MRTIMSLCMLLAPLVSLACTDDGSLADDELADAEVATPDAAPDDPPDATPAPDDGAVDAGPPPDALPPVSFAADIVPILRMRCGGCHLKASGGAGGLSFGVQAELARAAMVGQDTVSTDPDCADLPRVDGTTHLPEQSSLYLKLVGDACGKRMPSGAAATPLLDEQIELVRRWIVEGAQDN
jgi:hypothetical protein